MHETYTQVKSNFSWANKGLKICNQGPTNMDNVIQQWRPMLGGKNNGHVAVNSVSVICSIVNSQLTTL